MANGDHDTMLPGSQLSQSPGLAPLFTTLFLLGFTGQGCGDTSPDSDVISDATDNDTAEVQEWCESGNLYSHVDPLIGTGGGGFWGGGNGFAGAAAPFGLVRVGPDTQGEGDNFDPVHHSGYYYHDTMIAGFSQTHMHGTGITAYGNFMVSPVLDASADMNFETDWRQGFDKALELAEPGYYSVTLDSGVTAELTATERVAYHRYLFPQDTAVPCIILNAGHALTNNFILESSINLNRQTLEFTGRMRQLGGFSFEIGGLTVFVKGLLMQQPERIMAWDDNSGFREDISECSGSMSCRVAVCYPAGTVAAEIRVAVSFVSAEGAAVNLDAEGHHTFEEVQNATADTWRKLLDPFCPTGGTQDELTTFASALYRVFLMPTLMTDADGNYPGIDKKVHHSETGRYYSDFSLWDTYRTEHPLLTLVYPDIQRDFVMSMITMAREGGYLPLWPFVNGETNIMVGAPAEIVVADSYLKGIDFPHEEGLDLALKTALGPTAEDSQFFGRDGIEDYLTDGFVPADAQSGSVSKTLEYAVADNALCAMATGLGRTDVTSTLCDNRMNYKNLWNTEHRFFLGRNKNGTFPQAATFSPDGIAGDALDESNRDFVEGNPWHYLWFAPHDPEGLIELNGGNEAFVQRLEKFFADSRAEEESIPADLTLKGASRRYYWHGNEPGLHTAWLFSSAGRQDLTCSTVHWLMETYYGPTADGLPGNDDAGALSAWYVFSAMGIYPNPGTDNYWLGCPMFPEMKVKLPGGILKITSLATDTTNRTNILTTLNETPLDGGIITWHQIRNGGALNFTTD